MDILNLIKLLNFLMFVTYAISDDVFDCPLPTASNITSSGQCQRLKLSQCTGRKERFEEEVMNSSLYNCACDAECSIYGDCCPDVKINHKYANYFDHVTCRKFNGVESFGLEIYIVDQCPKSWPNKVEKELCESPPNNDLRSNTPVSGSNGVLFANFYCSKCHNIENPTYWVANITCDKDVSRRYKEFTQSAVGKFIESIGVLPFCHTRFEHPTIEQGARFCKPMISTCPEDWTDACMRQHCENDKYHISMVYQNEERNIYKNEHCAICNEKRYSCMDNITRHKITSPFAVGPPKGLVPLSVLIDFNNKEMTSYKMKKGKANPEISHKEIHSCPYKHVYNINTGICQEVICIEGFTFKNGYCQSEISILGLSNKCTNFLMLQRNHSIETIENNTYLIVTEREMYEKGDYIKLDNGSVLVCTNYTRNYSIVSQGSTDPAESFYFDRSQTILSLVGQLLSIIALSIHLFVYAILPSLRNLAGKNLMCLVSSLLAAQISFLAGVDRTEIYGICVVAACVIHYTYMASFFWMNIMSFDIWHTFTRRSPSGRDESQKKRFIHYSIYGWASPFIIVFIALVVNYSVETGKDIRPAYGEGICWITNKWGLIVFFAFPLAAIVISNLLFYCFTVYNIHKVSQSTKIATGKQSNRCRFLLYTKLCLIMGLTWIFAFIAILAKTPVLWYLFIILNSYQGVFICLSFLLTKNVVKLLREKWQKFYNRVRYNVAPQDDSDKSHATKSTAMSRTVSQDPKRRISEEAVCLEIINRYNNEGKGHRYQQRTSHLSTGS